MLSPVGPSPSITGPSPPPRALVHPNSNTILEFTPSEVHFHDCGVKDQNQSKLASLVVRNKTDKVVKINITNPRTAQFTLASRQDPWLLSPGLSVSLKVKCLVKNMKFEKKEKGGVDSYHDQILVKTDSIVSAVKLHAYPPRPKLACPRLVPFKNLMRNTEAKTTFIVKNTGSKQGSFKFQLDDRSRVTLSPDLGEIKPKGEAIITASVSTVTTGTFKCRIPLILEGQEEQMVDFRWVTGTGSLDVFLDGSKEPLRSLDFGTLYYGQEKRIRVRLLNSSTVKVSFATSFHHTLESKLKNQPLEENVRRKPIFFVNPSQGEIEAHKSLVVTCHFRPRRLKTDGKALFSNGPELTRDAKLYSRSLRIDCGDIDILKKMPVIAQAALADVKISRPFLDFGECSVNKSNSIPISLLNRSKILSLKFGFGKIAQFSVQPSKGILKPLENLDVVVTFSPHNLGRFKQNIPLHLADNLRRCHIAVKGTSHLAAQKTKRKDHSSFLPEDFLKEQHYVDPESPPRMALTKFTRATGIHKPSEQRRLRELEKKKDRFSKMALGYTYTIAQFEAKERHKKIYEDLIKNQRRERTRRVDKLPMGILRDNLSKCDGPTVKLLEAKIKQRHGLHYEKKDEDLGCEFAEGLDEPEMELPKPQRELQTTHMSSSFSSTKMAPRKKFKAKPTTKAERRDCEMGLTPDELFEIRTPKNIDMGVAYCGTEITGYFRVTNGLKRSILLEMAFDKNPSLKLSSPNSMMIPAGQTGTFTIRLQTTDSCEYKAMVLYTINSKIKFNFLITAEVVPLVLNASKDVLEFQFEPSNTNFFVTRDLLLTNPAGCDVEYWFDLDSEVFSMNPARGIVKAHGSAVIKANYHPKHAQVRVSEIATLQIKKGCKKTIELIGHIPEASCRVLPSLLDFGSVCVGGLVEQTIRIKNQGKSYAVFKIEHVPEELRIEPLIGSLKPREKFPLHVAVDLKGAGDVDSTVLLRLRGAKEKTKPLKLRVKAQVKVPDLVLIQKEIVFKDGEIGKRSMCPLTFENRSDVEVSVAIDLSSHPEFSLLFPSEWIDAAVASKAPKISCLDQKSKAGLGADGVIEDVFRHMRFTLGKYRRLKVQLQFLPQVSGSDTFELPVELLGIANYPSIRRVVKTTVRKPKFTVEPESLDLGKQIIETTKKTKYVKEFVIANNTDREESWALYFGNRYPVVKDKIQVNSRCVYEKIVQLNPEEEKDSEKSKKKLQPRRRKSRMPKGEKAQDLQVEMEKKCSWKVDEDVIFQITNVEGTLAPGESKKITVIFNPCEPIAYRTKLQLVLGDSKTTYLEIPLEGWGSFPMLSFSTQEVLLPICPLGVSSRAAIKVNNCGYTSQSISYVTSGEIKDIPLKVSFPNGSTLNTRVKTLEAQLTFKSKKPVSFSTKVRFLDSDENAFPLQVIGMTDNCLLSNQDYLTLNASKIDIVKPFPDSPIMVVDANGVDALSLQVYLNEKPLASLSILMRFLFAISRNSTFENVNLEAFHERMSESRSCIYNLVSALSGCKIFSFSKEGDSKQVTSPKPKDKGGNASWTKFQKIVKFFNFLKSYGGLMDMAKPEYLLTLKEFTRLIHSDHYRKDILGADGKTKDEVKFRLSELEDEFEQRSKQAWETVLYQIIKVFILQRITPTTYADLPGISKKGGMISEWMSNSNVYSLSECILLKWLAYHHKKLNPESYREPIRFDVDLMDGVFLRSVIISHVPTLHEQLSFNEGPLDSKARLIKNIIKAMKTIGLPLELTEEDFASPVARDMMIICLFLYQSLPNYLPKATIDFEGRLAESITKTIEFSNPSRKLITYYARIEGCRDFTLEQDVVQLEGKGKKGSKTSLKIHMLPRFSRSQQARLTLVGQGKDGTAVAPMVFNLNSHINSRKEAKVHNIESVIRTKKAIDLRIKNPFRTRCRFRVSLKQRYELYVVEKVVKEKRRGPSWEISKKKKHELQVRLLSHLEDTDSRNKNRFSTFDDLVEADIDQEMSVKIDFEPLKVGEYECEVIFLDEKAGEFMHLIRAKASLPPL